MREWEAISSTTQKVFSKTGHGREFCSCSIVFRTAFSTNPINDTLAVLIYRITPLDLHHNISASVHLALATRSFLQPALRGSRKLTHDPDVTSPHCTPVVLLRAGCARNSHHCKGSSIHTWPVLRITSSRQAQCLSLLGRLQPKFREHVPLGASCSGSKWSGRGMAHL